MAEPSVDKFGYVTLPVNYYEVTPVEKVISDATKFARLPDTDTLDGVVEAFARGIEKIADFGSHAEFLSGGFPDYRNDEKFIAMCKDAFDSDDFCQLARWAVGERIRVLLATQVKRG